MGHNFMILPAMMTGFCMFVLSYIFLNPLFRQIPGTLTNTQPGNTNRIYKPVFAVVTIGLLTLAVTSSTIAAVLTGAIPPLLCILKVLFNAELCRKRRNIIVRELPLFLDYLVLQVESGHSIQQAIRSAQQLFTIGSPLSLKLQELNDSIQVGCSISQALEQFRRALDTPEAETPILAIAQAIQHGTPLVKILREQSKRMRENLILKGEQFANAVSVKILIPLLFFIFPASFLVIFSPVIVSLSGRLP